jgi:hypothetical protein
MFDPQRGSFFLSVESQVHSPHKLENNGFKKDQTCVRSPAIKFFPQVNQQETHIKGQSPISQPFSCHEARSVLGTLTLHEMVPIRVQPHHAIFLQFLKSQSDRQLKSSLRTAIFSGCTSIIRDTALPSSRPFLGPLCGHGPIREKEKSSTF